LVSVRFTPPPSPVLPTLRRRFVVPTKSVTVVAFTHRSCVPGRRKNCPLPHVAHLFPTGRAFPLLPSHTHTQDSLRFIHTRVHYPLLRTVTTALPGIVVRSPRFCAHLRAASRLHFSYTYAYGLVFVVFHVPRSVFSLRFVPHHVRRHLRVDVVALVWLHLVVLLHVHLARLQSTRLHGFSPSDSPRNSTRWTVQFYSVALVAPPPVDSCLFQRWDTGSFYTILERYSVRYARLRSFHTAHATPLAARIYVRCATHYSPFVYYAVWLLNLCVALLHWTTFITFTLRLLYICCTFCYRCTFPFVHLLPFCRTLFHSTCLHCMVESLHFPHFCRAARR